MALVAIIKGIDVRAIYTNRNTSFSAILSLITSKNKIFELCLSRIKWAYIY